MRNRLTLAIIPAAALAALWAFPSPRGAEEASAQNAPGVPISGCRVTDGDTVRCGDERIRLLGIDAPELPGHCRRGRTCAPGDPHASTASLRAALERGPLTILRTGTDRYGRTLATMRAESEDLSCWQLRSGMAIYRADWDDGAHVRNTCPGVARP